MGGTAALPLAPRPRATKIRRNRRPTFLTFRVGRQSVVPPLQNTHENRSMIKKIIVAVLKITMQEAYRTIRLEKKA